MTEVRSQSCSACPYKKDTPTGLWAAHEYEKLAQYDEITPCQPFAAFMCHATPDHFCNGWAVVHSNMGHDHELIALRLEPKFGEPPVTIPDADLDEFYSSGTEAMEAGKWGIDHMTPEAEEAIDRLMRKYPRLKSREEWEEEMNTGTFTDEQIKEMTSDGN